MPERPAFFQDWPAEGYPIAVNDCLWALREYLPRRNQSKSYRWSARQALEQARYLGLTSIGELPPTQPRHQLRPAATPQPGQMELL